jgi:hypothetical protein
LTVRIDDNASWERAMILCQTCLSECPDSAVFCETCGEPLAVQSAARSQPAPQTGALTPTPQDSGALAASRAPVHPAWQPPAIPADPNVAPPASAIALRFANGDITPLSGKRDYLVGRRDVPAGIFPDVDLTSRGALEAGVSRSHAAIHLRPEGYFVEDLESANETLLNYQRLLPRQLYPIKDGDQLRFGLLSVLVIIG